MTNISSYPLRPLGEVCENHDSRRIPVKAANRKPGPFPYYGAQGIVDYVDDYIFDGSFVLVAEDGENLRSRNQDIALPANGKFWVNNHAHIIKGNSEASTRFLQYAINSSDISGFITGSTIPKLSQKNLHSIPIPWPTLVEQDEIVSLLGSLDDKIELNRRMNEMLESMAQAIFKDWFVDFGPTRAKAKGHEPYLAPELWDLFPDALDDEDKPEGWHHWTIADLALHHRATVAPAENPDRVFEHFSIPAYDAGRYPAIDDGASIKSRKTAIPANAVLLSKLNPNLPRVWIPNPPNSLPQVASTEFLAFTPKTPATRSLLYCLFRDIQFRREMEAMVTGTSKSHQRVSPKALVQRRVLTGASNAFKEFDRHASLLLSRVLRNTGESRILAQTRDLLLPKLLSGEIRFGEAEKAMETII